MGKALYRKYRSKSLAEIVGQEHITSTLNNALQSGKISHAYLFTGPRGTGKTSIARILAHEINQLPYTDDSSHLDIIEIDAASNRRIDEIRDLRERVHTAPTSAKYKVYIIDEVHMLTKEAFNALLKTLEEPPAHVVFILATTEAHKLPETIISRTQRFTFKPIDSVKVVDHLASIAKQENITIDRPALTLIANAGGGSFRDSISLLDQVSTTADKITAEDVQRALGIAPSDALDAVMQSLESHSPAAVVETLRDLKTSGYLAGQLAKQLIANLREQLVQGTINPQRLQLMADLLEVPLSHDVDTKLELVLIRYALGSTPANMQTPAVSVPRPVATIPSVKAEPSALKTAKPTEPVAVVQTPEPITDARPAQLSEVVPEPTVTEDEEPRAVVESDASFDAVWPDILAAVKANHNTLYGVLRMAEPQLVGNEVTLAFGFPFHQKRINEAKNKQTITDIIKRVTGSDYLVQCVVAKKGSTTAAVDATPADSKPAAPKPSINAISDIFGEAEVLDS